MRPQRSVNQYAFTITELMVTIVIASIVILGMGFVLADGYRGWQRMYNRVHGDVVNDAYVTRLTFDRIVRKSSITKTIGPTVPDSSITLFYYSTIGSANLDKYATFYQSGNQLLLDYGDYDEGTGTTPLSTQTLANNVQSVSFWVPTGGVSVCMVMTLDDGTYARTITNTAVRHNE
ncbi:MAG: prepilin-type N-terminal cleavage/methylation domain-containing protein [Sedimentisphaerales bacterium]|nr:prepilin-type N-terminal cleavage/methylation domain-containing protein [Sedimentisphaerales bacterium]